MGRGIETQAEQQAERRFIAAQQGGAGELVEVG